MNAPLPSLRTLIRWALEVEQGRPPAELAATVAASPAAAEAWRKVTQALADLRGGQGPVSEPLLPPDLVASYLDGTTDAHENAQLEQICWESPADLAELVSCGVFAWEQRVWLDASPALTERLAALVPGPTTEPAVVIVRPRTRGAALPTPHRDRLSARVPAWWLASGALVAIALLMVGLVWLARERSPETLPTPPVAVQPAPPVAPQPSLAPERQPPRPSRRPRAEDVVSDPPRPSVEQPRPGGDDGTLSPHRPDEKPPQRSVRPADAVPPVAPGSIAAPRPPAPPAVPNRVSAATVALRSEVGVVLVPGDAPGSWRVGRGELPLTRPLSVVSLADSWSTATIPGVGTLILAGDSTATLSVGTDQTVQIAVDQGQVGLHGLAAEARVRFATADGSWEARGVGDYSTLAVVRESEAASVYVSSGLIAIGETAVRDGQVSTVLASRAAAPQPLRTHAASVAAPFGANPYDPAWLSTPEEKRRRDWQQTYGKLVDRLAATDNVVEELQRLRSTTNDGRQQTLLARWNLALAADRGAALWDMLNDRQKLVRLAAAHELLALPARDGRFRVLLTSLRRRTDEATATRLLEWVARVRRSPTLAPAQARDLVDGLGHRDLAVRQMAVLLLEHCTREAFRAARTRPPAYDPDDPPPKRAVAQAQWKLVVAQLFPANRTER